ncbi:MAG: GGDEF domain-containing protein [Gammaproteobacteria bacterium]
MDKVSQQSLRLRRFGLALITYGIWAAFMLYVDALDLFRLEIGGIEMPLWWMLGGMVATNLMFLSMLLSGLNERFADPSLTTPMILVALTWAIVTAGGLPDARALSFSAFIVIFLFGIFNQRAMRYFVCVMYSMAGYSIVVYATLPPNPSEARVSFELMQGVLLFAMLFWVSFFGSYVGRLRERLHARHEELKNALELVEELAAHDDLTGLYNRRFVMGALAREQQRFARHGTPFAVILLDLDRFKEVNDTHGHPAGDELLKIFVQRIIAEVRDIDMVGAGRELTEADTIGRFGGEEFIVILPDTGLAGARLVAERIRESAASRPFETGVGEINVTVSIGVAQYRRDESIRSILERVDKALYAAKHAGRNRVAVAPPEPDATPMVAPT